MTADITLASLSGPQLVAAVHDALSSFIEARDLTVSYGRLALERAIRLGELFEHAVRRYPGEYEDWLHTNFPEVSTTSAWRYRNCYANRDRILADHPELAVLKSAYVALGMLPPPESREDPAPSTPRLYQLRLVVAADKPIETWPKIDLQEFIEQTSKVVEMHAKAKARLEEIA